MNGDDELTFFAWGDTHFGYEQGAGDTDIRYRAVRQMAMLPGYPYPSNIGGTVDDPSLILHCGDIADGGDFELGVYLHCMRQVDAPSYETLGNHDTPFVPWFIEKYGAKYHSFDSGHVHFVSLFQPEGLLADVPPIDDVQLHWLSEDLAKLSAGTPVVAFCHSKPDYVPNADKLSQVLDAANVVLMFCGHTHQQSHRAPHRYDWHGRHVAVVGHCRNHPIDPIYARTFSVVRMRGSAFQLVDWRWDTAEWA